MKTLKYTLSTEVITKNIKNPLYFLFILEKLPNSIFISKKILKKLNILSTPLFLHHPSFLMSFNNQKELHNFWNNLNTNTAQKIEYINLNYFKIHNDINLLLLLNVAKILKNLTFFLTKFKFLFNIPKYFKK